MAGISKAMIYELALDVLARIERLDAEIQAMLVDVRAMRAEAEAAQAGFAARHGAGRLRGV